jgi:SAM-dependent methyltransferase
MHMPMTVVRKTAFLSRQGFRDPRWLDRVAELGLREVEGEHLTTCPGCGREPERVVGQYVHYSHLARLTECGCGLWYSDLRLNAETVRAHFERAYKDDEYFRARRPVFEHLSRLVSQRTPYGGSVLDVGGATGHLALAIWQIRPDVDLTVTDVSERACAEAKALGLHAMQVSVAGLSDWLPQYDAVICSDVLYYEPDIGPVWETLARIVRPGGSLVIRGPNRTGTIRRAGTKQDPFSTRLHGFNPEHLCVFTRAYLEERLTEVEFTGIRTLPSPVGQGSRLATLAGRVACNLGPPVTPSVVTIARKP